jgi:succinoglycan biosynthesis transport protein ExoP
VTTRQSVRSDRPAGLDSALEVLGRQKWLALVVFCAAFCVVTSVVLSLPDLYRATATVLVERQQVSELFVRPSVTSELETRIQTIQQRVMSRSQLSELIARFDLYSELRAHAPLDAVVARLRRDIHLDLKGVEQPSSGRSATIAFAISYGGREPQTVASVANQLAGLYIDENTRIREGQAVQTAEFLKEQLADVKRQLDDQELRASEFKLSHIGELPQQVDVNLASLERLNTQLRLNGENQIRATDRRERLDKQLADSQPPPVSGGNAATPRVAALSRLRQQLADLRSRFTDTYPEVIRVQRDIAALEQAGDEPSTSALADPTPRLEQAIAESATELKALKNEELALRRAITGYEQRVENVPKRQEEFQTLSRDYNATKERYDTLLKRYEEAQLAESLEQGRKLEQFRMLDPAVVPREPAAPNRSRLLTLGFALAVGLAVAVALLVEKLNTGFHTIDDLRAFVSVSPVVRVPLILTEADTRRHRRRLTLTAAAVILGLALLIASSHYFAAGNEQVVRLMDRGSV